MSPRNIISRCQKPTFVPRVLFFVRCVAAHQRVQWVLRCWSEYPGAGPGLADFRRHPPITTPVRRPKKAQMRKESGPYSRGARTFRGPANPLDNACFKADCPIKQLTGPQGMQGAQTAEQAADLGTLLVVEPLWAKKKSAP